MKYNYTKYENSIKNKNQITLKSIPIQHTIETTTNPDILGKKIYKVVKDLKHTPVYINIYEELSKIPEKLNLPTLYCIEHHVEVKEPTLKTIKPITLEINTAKKLVQTEKLKMYPRLDEYDGLYDQNSFNEDRSQKKNEQDYDGTTIHPDSYNESPTIYSNEEPLIKSIYLDWKKYKIKNYFVTNNIKHFLHKRIILGELKHIEESPSSEETIRQGVLINDTAKVLQNTLTFEGENKQGPESLSPECTSNIVIIKNKSDTEKKQYTKIPTIQNVNDNEYLLNAQINYQNDPNHGPTDIYHSKNIQNKEEIKEIYISTPSIKQTYIIEKNSQDNIKIFDYNPNANRKILIKKDLDNNKKQQIYESIITEVHGITYTNISEHITDIQ